MADPMRIRAQAAGGNATVRVLMAHEMETGQRKDAAGKTIVSASTKEKGYGAGKANVENATKVGALLAERALAKNISEVVFDRAGFIYHGKVKALADAAREKGLKF